MNKNYYQAIHEIITTGHWITHEVTMALKSFGVTEPQYNVLRILSEDKNKPVTVGDILKNMVQRNSNVTRIVDKLVTKKYVTRQECPTNRRKMDIVITPIGVKVLNQLDQKVQEFHKSYYDKLSSKELTILKKLIQKLKS